MGEDPAKVYEVYVEHYEGEEEEEGVNIKTEPQASEEGILEVVPDGVAEPEGSFASMLNDESMRSPTRVRFSLPQEVPSVTLQEETMTEEAMTEETMTEEGFPSAASPQPQVSYYIPKFGSTFWLNLFGSTFLNR